MQQQIEREHPDVLPPRSDAALPALPAPMRPKGGLTVTVSAFQVAGVMRISRARIDAALKPYVGRPLDFAGLQAAAAAVAKVYRDAGWIVRAYLPVQDVGGRVVTIQVVEAAFGKVETVGKSRRVAPAEVAAVATAPLKPGGPLAASALDRGLLLAGDLPGVGVAGALKEGANPRQTDLVLDLTTRPLISGEVSGDNGGQRSTGAARALGRVTFGSLLGLGDEIDLGGLYSLGSDVVDGAFTIPVGHAGWRLGVNASHLDYSLVTSDFAPLHATGASTVIGAEAKYPLLRARSRNLYLSFDYAHKSFQNHASGQTISDYTLDDATVTLNGNLFDGVAGGGVDTASLALEVGDLDLNGSPNQAADALTTRSAGRFGKLNYRLGRRQTLSKDLFLTAQLSGQAATKTLDTSEKFYLGGPDGVRAYPVDEGAGSDGQMVDVALQRLLPYGFSLTGFYDWGHVTVDHGAPFAGAPSPNAYALQGAGASLAWRTRRGVSFTATYARRIGGNPNATAAGLDQDGSLVKNRFWLSGGLTF